MKRAVSVLISVLAIGGVMLLLWPKLHGRHMGLEAEKTVQEFYTHEVQAEAPEQYALVLSAMQDYNDELYQNHQVKLADPWAYESPCIDLSMFGLTDEAVAVLLIPSIDVELPVYLGASRDNMAKGTAVLGQTSMPIGGINTNCVIAGHRGWNGADFFRYITELKAGDEIILDNLWKTLHYKVRDTCVIDPDDVESVLIQEGKDMVTLLTCHPYASGGKYRYLVYCERAEGE